MIFSKQKIILLIGMLFLFFNFLETKAQGTYPVFEILPEFEIDGEATFLGALGNRLVYFDKDGSTNELWVSDGTAAGTFQIGEPEQDNIVLIDKGIDKWYFEEKRGNDYHISTLSEGSDELISLFVTNENPGKSLLWNGDIYFLQESATTFAADDLIKLDPITMTSEVLFTSDFGGIRGLGATDTEVMFIASMDEGKMIGKSDGTITNTQTFHKLYDQGSEFGSQVFMKSDGGQMFFFYHPNNEPYNLWVTDGTSPNTQILKEFDHPSFGTATGAFAINAGKFYFILRNADAPSGQTNEIHVSDGTVNGTFTLNPDPSEYSHPRQLRLFNNKIFFNSLDNNWGLKATDGTIMGTETIITPFGYQSGGIGEVFENGLYDGSLVISARNNDTGTELYLSNGTLAGTTLLADIIIGSESSYPKKFIQVDDLLFFSANVDGGEHLMVYDPNYNEVPCANFEVVDTILTNPAGDIFVPGSVEVTVVGGQGTINYELSGVGSSDTSFFTNLTEGQYTLTITDAFGCSLEINFELDNETSIINPTLVSSFSLFPNPVVAEDLNLKMEFTENIGQLDLVVFDLTGKLIYQEKIEESSSEFQQQIPVSNFSSGKYILTIRSDKQPIVVNPFIVKGK